MKFRLARWLSSPGLAFDQKLVHIVTEYLGLLVNLSKKLYKIIGCHLQKISVRFLVLFYMKRILLFCHWRLLAATSYSNLLNIIKKMYGDK